MNAKLIEQIRNMIPDSLLSDITDFNESTELESDLGITGDDASEFLFDFSQKFNIKLTHFDINQYFLLEGEDHLQTLLGWLRLRKIKKHNRKKLTIGDLIQAIKIGELT